MKKYVLLPILLLLFTIISCNSDDDNDDIEFVEIDATYTQAEKDAEIAWIENYILENEIPAIATESGLFYLIEKQGEGLFPDADDTVITHFTVTDPLTGEIIDQTNRENNDHGIALSMFQLVSGVQEGFLLINEGSVIKMIIPSFLGFGKAGFFDVPPEAILIFDMELNIVLKQ